MSSYVSSIKQTANATKFYQEKVTSNEKCIWKYILKVLLHLDQKTFCKEVYKEGFLWKQVPTCTKTVMQFMW